MNVPQSYEIFDHLTLLPVSNFADVRNERFRYEFNEINFVLIFLRDQWQI